jgi:hypothetical protein
MLVSNQMLQQKLYVLAEQRLVYLSNAKSGCSTMKNSLWKSVSPNTFDPEKPAHSRHGSPFVETLRMIAQDLNGLSNSTFFTVVRNPYSRLLSAYLDKVRRNPRDPYVWPRISNRFDFPPSSRPLLRDLLVRFAEEDPALLDPHFAPQYVNTLYDYVECDYVGHLEQMDQVADFLTERGMTISNYRKHSTSADESVTELLGEPEIDLIRKIYAKDFELFGYSEDPTRLEPTRPARRAAVGKTRLVLLLRGVTALQPGQCNAAFEELSHLMPEHESLYNRLEARALSEKELANVIRDIDNGIVKNWRIIAKVAEISLLRDAVSDAQRLLDKAVRIMRK